MQEVLNKALTNQPYMAFRHETLVSEVLACAVVLDQVDRAARSQDSQKRLQGDGTTTSEDTCPVFRITPTDNEEGWETVVDFTKIDKKGVPVTKVLKALKELYGEN